MSEENKSKLVQVLQVRPKFIPVLCPVCKGHKSLNWGKIPCTACNQKGYLEIPVEEVKNKIASSNQSKDDGEG